jgi:hypothetical protein
VRSLRKRISPWLRCLFSINICAGANKAVTLIWAGHAWDVVLTMLNFLDLSKFHDKPADKDSVLG